MEIDRRPLESQLRALEEAEQTLSAQRAHLHDRMSFYPDDATLAEREREVSRRRREVHARIDEIRVRLGLGPWRSEKERAEHASTASTGFDVDFSAF